MSAKIVELPVTRKTTTPGSVSLQSRQRLIEGGSGSGAALLSMRQHLRYKASLVFSDLDSIEQSYSSQVTSKLVTHVRDLLDREFGPLRVYKRRQAFVVSHHCMDSLVAGLLRVQFHCCQIPLPTTREKKGLSDICGVPLCWGVGQNLIEAEAERLEKQKY